MAQIIPRPATLLLLILLTTSTPPTAHSLPIFLSYSKLKTLLSLSHSLLTRVSNLRAERGDISGSNRAKLIAQKIDGCQGLRFWWIVWSAAGWTVVKGYGFVKDADFDLNELNRLLGELTRAKSEFVTAFVSGNYENALEVWKRLFGRLRLLKVFRQSGPLSEVVEALQIEVVEGRLLRDCLEIGSTDLKGLVEIFKDMTLQFYSTPDNQRDL